MVGVRRCRVPAWLAVLICLHCTTPGTAWSGESYPSKPIRFLVGFAPGGVSALLAVHPSMPVRTLKEFVALAKKQPGAITTASPGTSSIAHLALELFMHTAGIKLLHVPYKGGGPAAVDAIAGQVLSIMSISSTTAPHVQAGRLRGLGITSAKRSPILPNVPTIAESGYPSFE